MCISNFILNFKKMGWVSGIDSYRPNKFENIENCFNICVNNRTGFEKKQVELANSSDDQRTVVLVECDNFLNISSTIIRQKLLNSEKIDEFYKLIPNANEYISEKQLWNFDINFHKYEIVKKKGFFKSLSAALLTDLLKKINFTQKSKVLKYKENVFGETKGMSGTLVRISEIIYDDDCDKNDLVLKISGRACGYQTGLEAYFYSQCTTKDNLMFLKLHGIVEFENKSLLIMDYFENSTCIDRDEALSLPLTLISIKNLVSFDI
jgi:hypothetical protein